MKLSLPVLAIALAGIANEAWPAGKRAESYLAERTGLQRTNDPLDAPARARLRNLLASYQLPAQLTPATALSLHYASTLGGGELEVCAYTFARSSALDSTYRLLATRVAAADGDSANGRQQSSGRPVYVARSHYYLLLFDDSKLTQDTKEFLSLADTYADLLDD